MSETKQKFQMQDIKYFSEYYLGNELVKLGNIMIVPQNKHNRKIL